MKKVLVVDDDPDVCRLLQAKLASAQRYAVIVATGGRDALRVADAERPDLMLCDIDMPDMDGVSVAEAMSSRESTSGIPLIFLSALVTPADVRRGVTAGDRPMLSKNSSLEDLLASIDRALGVS